VKHWILLPFKYGTQDVMASVLDLNSSVAGFGVKVRWNELYDGMRYHLGDVLHHLNWAAEHSKQIVFMPIDKTFKDANAYIQSNPLPAYLANLARPNKAEGWTALRWHYEVATAWLDLLRHFSWLQGHPGFGGILLQETAPSLDELPDYSAQLYLDTYKRMLAKHQKLYLQLNFVPGGNKLAQQMCDPAVMCGNAMGGPDFLLEDESLAKTTFPLWEKARQAGVPLFAGISAPCYGQRYEGKQLDVTTMINLARLRGISELFWTYRPFGSPNIYDALKAI
jgi:hypothetical protein